MLDRIVGQWNLVGEEDGLTIAHLYLSSELYDTFEQNAATYFHAPAYRSTKGSGLIGGSYGKLSFIWPLWEDSAGWLSDVKIEARFPANQQELYLTILKNLIPESCVDEEAA